MATESSRPHQYYNSLFSPEQAYYMTQGEPGGQWAVACAEDYRVPSPLLRAEPDYCKLHFQVVSNADDGVLAVCSPRYPPTVENRKFAIDTQNITHDELVDAAGLLEQFKGMARPERLVGLAQLAAHASAEDSKIAIALNPRLDPEHFRRLVSDNPSQAYSQSEWTLRQQTAQQARSVPQTFSVPRSMDASAIGVSSLNPKWLSTDAQAPELVLLRIVRIERPTGPQEVVQGVWVDWPVLRNAMLANVRDLFPSAELVPADENTDDPGRLATIPAVFRSGPLGSTAVSAVKSGRAMLYVAWGGVIAALLAVGIVMRAIIDIGERRGRFVSAVTHELRTPLTTFCLYSEMLADGMVREEKAKNDYLVTLKRESQRLAKIVENVLCYARLAEVRASANTQQLDGLDLVDRIVPALARRSGEAGMQLVTDIEAARGARVEVDPQTVERILTNLVDNACKYARGHIVADGSDGEGRADHRIHLTAHTRPGGIEFRVADHGPGIPKSHRRAIFKAFNRARADTVSSAPGLGLGLSLARGLARELGGDLRLGPLPPGFQSGTVMSLVIPAVFEQATAPMATTSEIA
jgi:signal transduction histidine kinase